MSTKGNCTSRRQQKKKRKHLDYERQRRRESRAGEKEKEEKEQLLNTMMYGSTWGFDVDVSQRSPAAFVK
jgi:hypothetical protein